MKYLNRNELDDIASRLFNNPTRETLKSLSDKYNIEMSKIDNEVNLSSIPVLEVPNTIFDETVSNAKVSVPTFDTPEVDNGNVILKNNEINSEVNSLNIPVLEVPNTAFNEITPNTKVSVPTFNMPGVDNGNVILKNNEVNSEVISSNIPVLEVPSAKPENNTMVNFNGNLWEPQTPSITNMMETTDNFNNVQSTILNNNSQMPFFGNPTPNVNNQIPVESQVQSSPSMFGQIQQDYITGA